MDPPPFRTQVPPHLSMPAKDHTHSRRSFSFSGRWSRLPLPSQLEETTPKDDKGQFAELYLSPKPLPMWAAEALCW